MRSLEDHVLWKNRIGTMKPKSQNSESDSDLTVRKFSKAKSIAIRLGLCSRTIFRWADSGKIARHKINARVVLFDEAEIAKLIDSARVTMSR